MEAGRPQKGLDFLRRAQPGPKAERLPDLQFNMALAHNALGKSQEAASFFLQAAQLYRSQGDGGSEGDACMEMGRCYSRTQVRTRTSRDPNCLSPVRVNHSNQWVRVSKAEPEAQVIVKQQSLTDSEPD